MREKFVMLRVDRQILPEIFILLVAVLLVVLAPILEAPFSHVTNIAAFLTWHNLFELTGIIVCIAIFLVAFYAYNQTGRLRAILVGSLLLAAGILDLFHTLSYKGMPAFFVENLTANRATTLWIAARLISAVGFLFASLMNADAKSSVSRVYFTSAALTVATSIFVITTYFPSWLPPMYVEGSGLTEIKKLLEYVIMGMLIIASVSFIRQYVHTSEKMTFAMATSMLLSVLSEYCFTVYTDVYGIYNYQGHIWKFIAYFLLFRVVFAKNVQAPYIALTAAQKELREYADNLDKIVEHRTEQLKTINARLMEDLEYARDIQKAMLPVFLPDTPQIGFSAVYLPAERLSGDFYDVFKLDDDHMGFYVCDVSGHGVPAAMLTVFLKQCVDSVTGADRQKETISPPSVVLQHAYDAFNHSNFKDDVYIVLIYCIYNIPERKLICSSAGMNRAPILLNGQGEVSEIDIQGFPICKLKDICTVTYTEMVLPVKSGDRLYLYTDGLVEARNVDKQEYSPDRLKRIICENAGRTLEEQSAAITEDLIDFSSGKSLRDDVTLLIVDIR